MRITVLLQAGLLAANCPPIAFSVDFNSDVRPILEQNCLACHSGDHLDGDFDMSTRKSTMESGSSPPALVPYKPSESSLYTTTIAGADEYELMPPADAGGPISREQTELIRAWIAEGAKWRTGITMSPKAKPFKIGGSPDNLELVRKIHALVSKRSLRDAEDIADYVGTIPRTGVSYHMTAIDGGQFLMGSPLDEAQRTDIEGPQIEVTVDPFWMGTREVTWDEYEPFMVNEIDRKKNGARKDYDPEKHTVVDAVSAPTAPYIEMSFGMGQKGYPAISMTQHAASKYCQWLSAQTGHFYRLPTEAEWEYACRAGTSTAYSFGEDTNKIGDYAWYYENSNEQYQKVGTKKPNPWGLFDMHGNVMEWTIDRFSPKYFPEIGAAATNPFLRPKKLFPRSVRGGSWNDDPDHLRSAFRKGSDASWKMQDPQLPKSIWYHTDAQWLGFRIVRPKKTPSPEEMYFYWNSASGKIM